MNTLLLVAHGSRRAASNEEIEALAESLRPHLVGVYDEVQVAFLELAQPDVPTAIAKAVGRGAGKLVMFPYFLAAGRHVAEDLPALLREARQAHPGVDMRMLPHLGAQPALTPFLAQLLG